MGTIAFTLWQKNQHCGKVGGNEASRAASVAFTRPAFRIVDKQTLTDAISVER